VTISFGAPAVFIEVFDDDVILCFVMNRCFWQSLISTGGISADSTVWNMWGC
jgi:hypothetical protein